jgi:mercuric ion binding protein
MMKPVLATLLTIGLLPAAAMAAERTVTLAVENMTCALCPVTVSHAIKAVPGVAAVKVDRGTHTAVVTFDDAATSTQLVADASTNAGYPAKPVER